MCSKRSLLSQLIGTWNRTSHRNNSIVYVVVNFPDEASKLFLTHHTLVCFAVQGTMMCSLLSTHCLMIIKLKPVSMLELK